MTGDSLEARLAAVERAVTDGEGSVADLSDAAAVHERLDGIEADLRAFEERLDALDATVQSLHGYVGEIESVNEDVARRADAARAAVERLEDERRRVETPVEGRDATQRGVAADAPATADRPESGDDESSLLDRVRGSL